MIQRPQSLFLLLGAVALVALLFLDIVWQGPAADSYGWFTLAILAMASIIGLGAIGTIFLYQDRQRQKQIVVYLQFATVLFLFVFYGALYMMGDLHFMREGATSTGKVIALALPIIAYILFYLARRGIIRDINLVRSMDRLR